MSIKILGANVSPFVRKVRAFCAEKGIAYTLEPINPFSPPEGWREISPLGTIPALDHDGRIVNDSSVICAYLEKIQPEPALYPKDAYDYARAVWIEEFADGGVVPIAGPEVFMPLVLAPLRSRKEPDASTIEAAKKCFSERVEPRLAYLESQLGASGFFVGNRLTIADVAVGAALVNLRHAGFAPDASRLPKLAAFIQRMHARPSLKVCIDEEKPVFGKRWV